MRNAPVWGRGQEAGTAQTTPEIRWSRQVLIIVIIMLSVIVICIYRTNIIKFQSRDYAHAQNINLIHVHTILYCSVGMLIGIIMDWNHHSS